MKPFRTWIVLPLLLVACTSLYPPPRQFLPTQQDFAERLRWLDLQGAARHFAPELQQEFLAQFAGTTDLRITDVRLESADYFPETARMITWTVVEYYQLPSNAVRTHRFRQEWEYLGEERFRPGTWQIITPFPGLTAPPRGGEN